ncbi:hypothetical protein P691DRAFT_766826 [Macrolepiota fuliginosa MF-IS2]|uniref:Uncharacterized protein n=1 Tax=Macrolepiota fuliginosa MF-IS2 TaxID=1400762 RepID=A0A9P6BX11_9AGAR|nr:hypothetical protein P691DRAFT_766826 [Macrolepiota fuliginosa MF-IS2]
MSNQNEPRNMLSITELQAQMEAKNREYEEWQAHCQAQLAEALQIEEERRQAEEVQKAEEQCCLAAEAEEQWLVAKVVAHKLEEAVQREWAAEERHKKQRVEKVKKGLSAGHAAELQEACRTNELLQELIKTMAGIKATQQEQLQVTQSTCHQGQAGLEDLESEESGDEFEEGASGDLEDGEEEEEEEEAEEEMEVEKEKEKASGEGREMEVN